MPGSIARLARSAGCAVLGLLLFAPAAAIAQAPEDRPAFQGHAAAGFALGTLGYRFGTFQVVGGPESGMLYTARALVGSRPVHCGATDSECDGRADFVAILGGVQWISRGERADRYFGLQVGHYSYEGLIRGTGGLTAAVQAGLRLPLGSFGGAYGDLSCILVDLGCIPTAGIGLYVAPSPSRHGQRPR